MLILNILTVIDFLESHDIIPFDYSVEDGYVVFFDFGYNIEIVIEAPQDVLVVVRGENGSKAEHIFNFDQLRKFIKLRSWLAGFPSRNNNSLAPIIELPIKSS